MRHRTNRYGYFLKASTTAVLLSTVVLACDFLAGDVATSWADQGVYFAKKEYAPQPVPVFSETKGKLPAPIFDEDPVYVECYWKVWELAFKSFRKPYPGSPLVSNYIDEAFNSSLFLWDTAFMTMFCNYAHPYVPGIQSLDNFYCTQLDSGEIVREISEQTGVPHPCSRPGTPDSLNHPILAWAEREAYRISGDKDRLRLVYVPLVKYYRSYSQIRDGDTGFYKTSWASMDNSPRIEEMLCGIDTTAEIVLFARDLSYIAAQLGKEQEAQAFEAEAQALAEKINQRLWDEQSGFYYDWATDGSRHNVRTIAAFWTLLAGVPDRARATRLVAHLRDKEKFHRTHMVPTVPADQQGYHPQGDYWRGSIWTPTNTMVIRGLQRYGDDELAREIALNHLQNVVEVYKKTGTVWENYAPDSVARGSLSRADFVGWTGIGPIVYFIEHAVGIKVDAPANTIVWDITSPKRVGVENLWFGGKTVSLVCAEADDEGKRLVRVQSDGDFLLRVRVGKNTKEIAVPAGRSIEIGL